MNKKAGALGLGLQLNVNKQPEAKKCSVELGRTTKVSVLDNNGQPKEYEISYEELKEGGLLGRGTFGTVKKVFHEKSGLTFAVKMISDEIGEALDSRNADIMDLVVPLKTGDNCPYLVKFYGALHSESCIWILTEVMDTSLDRFYAKVFSLNLKMPELLLSKVAFAILSALEFMRNLKVLHRDIKPSNVLMNENGDIKVCDFGISGFVEHSISKSNKGCQYYSSPEKIEIKEGYSVKADIWSLGISLIEVATNKHPFKDCGLLKLYATIMNEESPKLDPKKFSQEFCIFVDKCLIKNHHDRPNCVDMLQEPFIKKFENAPNYVEFIKSVIEELKKEPINA